MEVLKDVFNVLYVDDEENNLNSFRAALRRNYNIYTALSGEEGIEILSKTDIHVIVTDQRMPHMTGVQFLQHIPDAQTMSRSFLQVLVIWNRSLRLLTLAKFTGISQTMG
jgi:Response regulator containing CheY-like receiver, AAA-type ATPase, and DNA-binding domains